MNMENSNQENNYNPENNYNLENNYNPENDNIKSWDQFNLKDNLLRGIYAYGFEKPSPIQNKAILPIISKRDIIAQAQSGTGKTGTFSISCLQNIDENSDELQALIISPTRELSTQIHNVISSIGNFIENLKIGLFIGGQSWMDDNKDIRKKPQIAVATPGRINDLLNKKKISGNNIKMLIIDEADEMLSQGFKQQLYDIFQFLNNDIQVVLCSATLPVEIQSITDKFMRDPIKILVKTEAITLEGINQYYIALDNEEQKYETLKDLFNLLSINQTIIYCNSIKRVEFLYNSLLSDNFPVICIHSGMSKDERNHAYNSFKRGENRVLISSNLTARGIDVQQVSTVINYDIPKDIHLYIHRIGRSGRWGRKGLGINFVTKFDVKILREIEVFYSTQITEFPNNINVDKYTH